MKKPSEYVKIPRRVIEEVLKEATAVESQQKAEHLKDDPASAYAYALGQSAGRASMIKILLGNYLNA